MTDDRRTFKLGQRQELIEEIRKLEYAIDAIVQTLEDQFRLKTRDLSYIKDIDADRVKSYANDIARLRQKHKRLLDQLKEVKRELGEEDD